MPFQVEKDIDITDFAAVEEELKRLVKQLGYVKTQVTKRGENIREDRRSPNI